MITECENPSSYDERVRLVHEWQRYYKMEPRKDSKLTEMFASGNLNMFPDQVARELMATDFIYKYTLYGELIEEFMRKVAGRLKCQYDLTWTSTWNIVRFYAPIGLKLICLLQTQRVIPQYMPTPEENEADVFSPSSAPDEPTYPRIPSTLSSMDLDTSSPSTSFD
ncbi:MAG: hypothetical protein CBC65_001625 [Rhodothermaceae bacterium TMED105]|jgi:hypothetical protein|nr:MAG: hypothetical protein CBC65_001625 [Rhodothermaceae bacterium TMED105]|tara:strand:- start:365 stop:862 length:498 start_codon:yes stop_codon:yes gene_type:complete